LHGFHRFLRFPKACVLRIAGKGSLDIQGHVVEKLFLKELCEDRGISPVGVEFNKETQVFQGANEFGEIGGEGGLAAGEDHTVQKTQALRKSTKNRLRGKRPKTRHKLRKNEFRVIAKRAAEITSGEEHDSRKFPWVIAKGKGLEVNNFAEHFGKPKL
jgi:hypothetical protein